MIGARSSRSKAVTSEQCTAKRPQSHASAKLKSKFRKDSILASVIFLLRNTKLSYVLNKANPGLLVIRMSVYVHVQYTPLLYIFSIPEI